MSEIKNFGCYFCHVLNGHTLKEGSSYPEWQCISTFTTLEEITMNLNIDDFAGCRLIGYKSLKILDK